MLSLSHTKLHVNYFLTSFCPARVEHFWVEYLPDRIEFNLLSLKVRGLRNQPTCKRQSIFCHLKDQNYLFTSRNFLSAARRINFENQMTSWDIFLSWLQPQKSVTILTTLLLEINIENSWGDQDRRIVLIKEIQI